MVTVQERMSRNQCCSSLKVFSEVSWHWRELASSQCTLRTTVPSMMETRGCGPEQHKLWVTVTAVLPQTGSIFLQELKPKKLSSRSWVCSVWQWEATYLLVRPYLVPGGETDRTEERGRVELWEAAQRERGAGPGVLRPCGPTHTHNGRRSACCGDCTTARESAADWVDAARRRLL